MTIKKYISKNRSKRRFLLCIIIIVLLITGFFITKNYILNKPDYTVDSSGWFSIKAKGFDFVVPPTSDIKSLYSAKEDNLPSYKEGQNWHRYSIGLNDDYWLYIGQYFPSKDGKSAQDYQTEQYEENKDETNKPSVISSFSTNGADYYVLEHGFRLNLSSCKEVDCGVVVGSTYLRVQVQAGGNSCCAPPVNIDLQDPYIAEIIQSFRSVVE